MDAQQEERALGLGAGILHLQLSSLTEARLSVFKLRSITDLFVAVDRGLVSEDSIGLVAWKDVRKAVADLKGVISPEGRNHRLAVTAYYQPRGLFGKIYWFVFLPFHYYIFNDLIRQIVRRA